MPSVKQTQAQSGLHHFTSFVTLGKLFNFSEPISSSVKCKWKQHLPLRIAARPTGANECKTLSTMNGTQYTLHKGSLCSASNHPLDREPCPEKGNDHQLGLFFRYIHVPCLKPSVRYLCQHHLSWDGCLLSPSVVSV